MDTEKRTLIADYEGSLPFTYWEYTEKKIKRYYLLCESKPLDIPNGFYLIEQGNNFEIGWKSTDKTLEISQAIFTSIKYFERVSTGI